MKLNDQILYFLANNLKDVQDNKKIAAQKYANLYQYFCDRSKSAVRRTIEDLLLAGDVSRVIEGHRLKFRISSQGKTKLIRKIPAAFFYEEKWDNLWRVIIFEIPETEKKLRSALREMLKDSGFRRWQKSVYLSPFKITEELSFFIKTNDLIDNTIIFETKKIFSGNNREIARELWDLDELNNQYLAVLKLCGNLNSLLNRIKVDQVKIKGTWQKLREDYYHLALVDPGLPRTLLPDGWLEKEIRQTFVKTAKIFKETLAS